MTGYEGFEGIPRVHISDATGELNYAGPIPEELLEPSDTIVADLMEAFRRYRQVVAEIGDLQADARQHDVEIPLDLWMQLKGHGLRETMYETGPVRPNTFLEATGTDSLIPDIA